MRARQEYAQRPRTKAVIGIVGAFDEQRDNCWGRRHVAGPSYPSGRESAPMTFSSPVRSLSGAARTDCSHLRLTVARTPGSALPRSPKQQPKAAVTATLRQQWRSRSAGGRLKLRPTSTSEVFLINADKPLLWKPDVMASVDMYNQWFMRFAPQAYRDTRVKTAEYVEDAMRHTADFAKISPADLKARPDILPTLRMSTAPPIARDRLIGLAYSSKNLVATMEERKRLPPRLRVADLDLHLQRICRVLDHLLDRDLFPWLAIGTSPTEQERARAATIVADRLCGAVADPIIRNAQEVRQLALIEEYLTARGYRKHPPPPGQLLTQMQPGTFEFRMIVVVGTDVKVNIPIDVVIQPKDLRPQGLPILIEAKSAGDFTNTNKRRKEEATKIHQLRAIYGPDLQFVLFLCGYFDSGYLGYEAAEGLDWIWEHRITDMEQLGI